MRGGAEEEARAKIEALTAVGRYKPKRIVTQVAPAQTFWRAEEYHQNFFARNPYQGYCMAVAAPKVAKFRATFARLQKA